MKFYSYIFVLLLVALIFEISNAQQRYELNKGWVCKPIGEVAENGQILSRPLTSLTGWVPATVPGTVLTTLLNNKKIPDPLYGMNNNSIPDINDAGNQVYTYWFVNNFHEKNKNGEQIWLQLRGVNYACDVFVNGIKLNKNLHEGMLLRQSYNITPYLSADGNNRLAVLVYPPPIPGNANGGQGGDGTIAKNLTAQYTAGWDWIQPIRDRNTGIWDKVFIEKTGVVNIQNVHVVTQVVGKRMPNAATQAPAQLIVSAEVENTSTNTINVNLKLTIDKNNVLVPVVLMPNSKKIISLKPVSIINPKLWWPNGYGSQNLYDVQLSVIDKQSHVLDAETVQTGIREITNTWNNTTGSMQTFVNGQPIFIKGGNWIISDAMLRFSKERYDAEVRMHRDMNLNLIRIWGGAIIERPEFYEACDKYGLLVFQDFWFSGDCNGRWLDPMKKDDQWTRRKYPDNHKLAIEIAADQIKLIRNHPSLAFWCGGNEITPPNDILHAIKDSLLPQLDGTRYFFDYSNSDSMSRNTIGGNGDGPYTIQDDKFFWQHQTFPYNSEVGSVGVGDYASLQKFIPPQNMQPPTSNGFADSVWTYHRYIGYYPYIEQYGTSKDAKDFTAKAQLINYNQYRALMEGLSAHMWQWYTGSIIWKTQNPWTALRGQMYDYYLDVNACLYGLRKGSERIHIMMNPVDSMVLLVNNTFETQRNVMIEAKVFDVITGKDSLYTLLFTEIPPSCSKKIFAMSSFLTSLNKRDGAFVSLKLYTENKNLLSENFYWLPADNGNFIALQNMPAAIIQVYIQKLGADSILVDIKNKSQQVAFFNRIALIDKNTRERILPTFFSDNYISILPNESKQIILSYPDKYQSNPKQIQIYGWNVAEQIIDVH